MALSSTVPTPAEIPVKEEFKRIANKGNPNQESLFGQKNGIIETEKHKERERSDSLNKSFHAEQHRIYRR